MTLGTTQLRPHAAPFRPRSARLVLGSASRFRRPDGAWWPRTRDLARELGELADVIDPLWGRLTHVAVNPRHWLLVPRGVVVVNDHEVTVDRFAVTLNPHRILLQSYTAGRWDLLVVPPLTSASSAARLMAASASMAT
ncbi:DUF5994 family protein [Streptomyces sp.]|uniref:DUF5994 family protein n=1 Tax=Streptomyces sp. TaxID=1931 RepID=UPI0028110F88|nr:DUF5994 family protein [Streptomyces sp.]